MTSDFEGFFIPDFIHYIYFPVLDWGLNPGPPALDASPLPLGYQGGGSVNSTYYWLDIEANAKC